MTQKLCPPKLCQKKRSHGVSGSGIHVELSIPEDMCN